MVSDFTDGPHEPDAERHALAMSDADGPVAPADAGAARARAQVAGGYLERLALACVKDGLVDAVEIWRHWRGAVPPAPERESEVLTRRAFRRDGDGAPFASRDMVAFVERFDPPTILLVLGLGVDEAVLEVCRDSLIVYNSIDAPSLRVPPEASRHFDLVITGAPWQSHEVTARHPGMPCLVQPIGPEFAAIDQFRPLGTRKRFDVVYVAAAQAYKRHDILFDALAARSDLTALCVFGYGERADAYRAEIAARGLGVTCVGPPGVPFAQVNHLMNEARIGVVCGEEDGAPAILTEYMLAGLPVLANIGLCCGLQFITPETGATATAEEFGDAIAELVARADRMNPRDAVLARWTWPHSIERFREALAAAAVTRGKRAIPWVAQNVAMGGGQGGLRTRSSSHDKAGRDRHGAVRHIEDEPGRP